MPSLYCACVPQIAFTHFQIEASHKSVWPPPFLFDHILIMSDIRSIAQCHHHACEHCERVSVFNFVDCDLLMSRYRCLPFLTMAMYV